VKFSPVEEIASKFAIADFQNFCRLASKKSAESAVFFVLEGTLLGGGQGAMPRGGTFRGGGTLVKRRNDKWSFTNEPEVRFRF